MTCSTAMAFSKCKLALNKTTKCRESTRRKMLPPSSTTSLSPRPRIPNSAMLSRNLVRINIIVVLLPTLIHTVFTALAQIHTEKVLYWVSVRPRFGCYTCIRAFSRWLYRGIAAKETSTSAANLTVYHRLANKVPHSTPSSYLAGVLL